MRNAGQNHEIAKIFVVLLRSSNKYLGTIFYMAVRTVPVTLVVLILYYQRCEYGTMHKWIFIPVKNNHTVTESTYHTVTI